MPYAFAVFTESNRGLQTFCDDAAKCNGGAGGFGRDFPVQKVFEELVTGRHESGSHYTPRPIVQFMCREALKGYLAPFGAGVGTLVDFHDASAITNHEAVLAALRSVKVVDPACGSGAYLLGMLQELMALRLALFNAKRLDDESTYNRKLEIIQNNIYGVDLDPFAVNTARLRLWLSLVVEDGRDPLNGTGASVAAMERSALLPKEPDCFGLEKCALGNEVESKHAPDSNNALRSTAANRTRAVRTSGIGIAFPRAVSGRARPATKPPLRLK